MSIHQLRALVAIADSRSFRAAAERLHRTQAAISQQIKALEDSYGGTLFDRETRPARLTPRGVMLVEHARRIIADYDSLPARLDAKAPLSGQLRIGVIPTASIRLLPDLIATMANRHPDVTIRIDSGLSNTLQARLQSGAIDAALMTRAGPLPDDLDATVIQVEPMVLARAGRPGDTPKIADFDRLPFIRFRRSAGVGRVIDAFLTTKSIVPVEAMELDSIEAIIAVVANGLGMTIVPEADVHRYAGETVRTAPIDLKRSIILVTRRGDQPLMTALADLLRNHERLDQA
ncbi:MAG: LysR family transcriptional regulator [Pseudomonadota bacterium]